MHHKIVIFMERINSKEISNKLYEKGVFGNVGRTWNSFEEYLADQFNGPVTIRTKRGLGGGLCIYDLNREQIIEFIEKNDEKKLEGLWINASFPKDFALLQGEFMSSLKGPYLYCSFERGLHMRDALKKSHEEIYGIRAIETLRHFMSPLSFDDFQNVREMFPDSTLELSVYDCDVGKSPGRNSIIWEVRDY